MRIKNPADRQDFLIQFFTVSVFALSLGVTASLLKISLFILKSIFSSLLGKKDDKSETRISSLSSGKESPAEIIFSLLSIITPS